MDDEALVVHWDGQEWQRVRVGAQADLWWLQVFDDGTIVMAGDRGTVLKGDGRTFSALPTPSETATLYGVWGTSSDDLWTVGTDGSDGLVWRWRGDAFEPADIDGALLQQTTLFKVWGRSGDDVWMVGDQGRILHFDGEKLRPSESDNHVPLVTVHGTDRELYAVGGLGGSVIMNLQGNSWHDLTPPDAPAVNGVFARGDVAYVVGAFGEVLKRSGQSAFERVETGLDLAREYHAVWIDEDDGVWAVGGHVNDAPLVQGLLSHAGAKLPSSPPPSL